MDREALDRYVDRSVELVSASPQMDEQNTRAKLVDPLVRDVLGWDLDTIDRNDSCEFARTDRRIRTRAYDRQYTPRK